MQYGEKVQALVAYFSHQHFIPIQRICQLFEDIFGMSISAGTCANIEEKLFQNLEVFESSLKAYLVAGSVLHFDETG
ncbi:transposase, partial [Lacticaseibacillus paracasei]